MRKMTEEEKNFHRNYQKMKKDLKKEDASPFLFLLKILDDGGDTYVKQFLRYVKDKNAKKKILTKKEFKRFLKKQINISRKYKKGNNIREFLDNAIKHIEESRNLRRLRGCRMTKDEMKNRISMALKDPILQQGFEIICKENAELKKEIGCLRTIKDDYKKLLKEIKEELTEKEIDLDYLKYDLMGETIADWGRITKEDWEGV